MPVLLYPYQSELAPHFLHRKAGGFDGLLYRVGQLFDEFFLKFGVGSVLQRLDLLHYFLKQLFPSLKPLFLGGRNLVNNKTLLIRLLHRAPYKFSNFRPEKIFNLPPFSSLLDRYFWRFVHTFIYCLKNCLRKSPGIKIGKSTAATTRGRIKCFVFHVTKASGLAAMALANIGASLVGSNLYAARTCRRDGFLVRYGGISKNERHAAASIGNFNSIFRSASSSICGEIIGTMSAEKHAEIITPAAPVGELNPARSALVSRN